MNDDINWTALSNCLAGRATLAQRAELARWIREDPARQQMVHALHEVWTEGSEIRTPVGEVDVKAAWEDVDRRMGIRNGRHLLTRSSTGRTTSIRRETESIQRQRWSIGSSLLRIAAVVLVAAGAVIVFRHADVAPKQSVLATREIRTEKGQRAELRLDDGSRVVLGVDSRLRWDATFGADTRDVYVEGQALFEVAHNPSRLFRVHMGDAIAEDLGTEFAVRAYPDDGVLVAVKHGAVSLTGAHNPKAQPTVLNPGDVGRLTPAGQIALEHDVNVDHYLAFAAGRLVFQRTPMADVAKELQRWYDVRIVLADSSLANVRVSASFKNEGLNEVLAMLTTTLGARVERQGQTVTLYSKP